jgi:hypothetical protein
MIDSPVVGDFKAGAKAYRELREISRNNEVYLVTYNLGTADLSATMLFCASYYRICAKNSNFNLEIGRRFDNPDELWIKDKLLEEIKKIDFNSEWQTVMLADAMGEKVSYLNIL